MTRGNVPQCKVIFKGSTDSFVVFVEGEQAVKDWKNDRSVPLAQVVAGFKIFQTHKLAFLPYLLHSYIHTPSRQLVGLGFHTSPPPH